MSAILNPYIHLQNSAREAITFYQSVFGGELTISTFKEGGMDTGIAAEGNLIMHGQLDAPNGLTLMVADTPAHMDYNPGGTVDISLSGDDEETLTGWWHKLADGATINLPLEKAPWGASFGMLTDKFGIDWMVNITGASAS